MINVFPFLDICHWKGQEPSITMGSMFRQDLAQLSIFHDMPSEQLDTLDPLLELIHFQQGELIFEQGRPADFLFILLSGQVEVHFKPYDGPPLTVARIFPGGVFGWSAALMRDAYTSSSMAVEEGEAYKISGCTLRALCEREPDLGTDLLSRLASGIAQRLNNTHTEIVNILTSGLDGDESCTERDGDDDGK